MVNLQSGHGIPLKGQTPKCGCEGQKKKKKRQKRINSMPLHLSQLRSHKHRKEEKIFKPPSVLVHQLIRSLHRQTLRPVIRSPSPLYLGKPPMMIQI